MHMTSHAQHPPRSCLLQGTVSVLDSHGLAQVIDMVLAGAAGEPRAAPARGGGPEFAQDSDLDIRRTQSGLLAGPPPSTGIVTSIMPGGVPAAIAGQRAGSLRETTLLVGSRRASSARPSHARGEERAPPAPPARESGAEGGSVVMGGEDSAGPGEPSVAALSGPIEAPRASPTSLQVRAPPLSGVYGHHLYPCVCLCTRASRYT